MGANLSNKLSSDKIIVLFLAIMIIGAVVFFLSESKSNNSNSAPLKKESGEFTSKRILAIISDTKWREGHIQFDHIRLMGFNLTVVKVSEYKPDMLDNADVVLFDNAADSVDIKDKDSMRNFVEKKGKNVIFISPIGLNDSWKKEKYPNTPFINLNFKATEAKVGLNISGQIILTTQTSPEWIYQLNKSSAQNMKIWSNNFFLLLNRTQVPVVSVPVAYVLHYSSGGNYIIYSGSHLALLPAGLIQSLIYLDKPHFEIVYTKDNIKNNFTYLIRIDDVGDSDSKKVGQEKMWNTMIEFDKLADSYGFGVNHLLIMNRTKADDVLTYLRGYKNGKWVAVHGWNHNQPDGLHPEFEIDNKTFQDGVLNKSKERFYKLFGYYPKYIATPWNAHRYNFSGNSINNDYGSLTLFKKYGFFVYSLYPEQGSTYAPFMVDNVIVIQPRKFIDLKNPEFKEIIKGADSGGWIIENYGHYFEENLLKSSKTEFSIVSGYNVWNPDPNEFAEFLHALSGLEVKWIINKNEATMELKSNYTVPAGFTIKLDNSDSTIEEVYIDNTRYNYFTDKKITFPEISEGIHTVRIYFKN
jgi:hypothetical protein